MKPVFQIEYRKGLGDCLRACLATILEFNIEDMPNFWEQTQNANIFWQLVNKWLSEKYGYKCIIIEIQYGYEHIIQDVLCIAHVKPDLRIDEEHAVVWRNGLVHNPSIGKQTFAEPDTFTLLVPINPFDLIKRN